MAAHNLVEELHAGAAHYNQGTTGSPRKVIDGEDGEDLSHFVTEGSTEELEISAVTHPSFGGFMELHQKPQGVKLPYERQCQAYHPPCPANTANCKLHAYIIL